MTNMINLSTTNMMIMMIIMKRVTMTLYQIEPKVIKQNTPVTKALIEVNNKRIFKKSHNNIYFRIKIFKQSNKAASIDTIIIRQ